MSTLTHSSNDTVLAAIFDPTTGPAELPAKTGLSLQELARWLKANAAMVAEVREFLTQRAALIGSRLHLSSLAALDRVIRESPDLERVRKAASTILKSLKSPTNPTRERGAPCVVEPAQPTHARGTGVPPVTTCSTNVLCDDTLPKRASPADRFAAMRLARLESGRTLSARATQ